MIRPSWLKQVCLDGGRSKVEMGEFLPRHPMERNRGLPTLNLHRSPSFHVKHHIHLMMFPLAGIERLLGHQQQSSALDGQVTLFEELPLQRGFHALAKLDMP